MKKIFILLTLALMSYSNGYSTHVMGGGITWKCLGNDSFLVTATVYRDCNGVALSATPISISSTCGTKTYSTSISKGVDITPICGSMQTRCSSSSSTYKYGVEAYKLTTVVDLSSWRKSGCCEVTMAWSQCCRNGAITTGSASQNFFVTSSMSICQSPCVSSPEWSAPPKNILCLGRDVLMSHEVKVGSGSNIDSVVYDMTNPMISSVGKATWSGSFNYDAPLTFLGFPKTTLPFPRGFHMDSETGMMMFRPMKAEQTVMRIRTQLYKKGKKVGEISRDFQLIVVKCPSNNVPVLSGISCATPLATNFTTSACAGSKICFDICATDRDSTDTLSMYWNGGIPGASFTILNPSAQHKTGRFCWTPKASDAGKEYSFVVTTHDSKCPVPATTSRSYRIKVTKAPTIQPSLSISAINGCGKYHMVMSEANNKNLGKVLWYINDSIPIGTGDSIEYTFSQKGYYWVSGVIDSCHNIVLRDSVNVKKLSNLEILNLSTSTICAGKTLTLAPKVTGAQGQLSYQWIMDSTILADSLNASKTNLQFPNRVGFYRVKLIVSDATSGCSETKEIFVFTKKSTPTQLERDEVFCLKNGSSIVRRLALLNGQGTWTGTGVTNNEFNTSGLSAGGYVLRFSLEDSSTCYEDTATFILRDKPTVSAGRKVTSCLGADPIQLSGIPNGGSWSGKGVVNTNEFDAQKAGIGVHQLTYTFVDSFGCGAKSSVNARVFDYEPVVIAPDSAYSCSYGKTFSITGSPKGGKWFGGGFASAGETLIIDPNVVGSGNYELVYSYRDSNQCSGSDTSKVIIYETPSASFNILDSLIDQDDTLPIKNNSYEVNGSQYTWEVSTPTSKTAIGFEPTIVMDQLGMHDVSLYTMDTVSGCGDTLIKTSAVRVVKIVGLENPLMDGISLYPNPISDRLFVLNESGMTAEIKIISMNGQLVLQQRIQGGTQSIEMNDLPSGIYQITLTNNQLTKNTVIVKK